MRIGKRGLLAAQEFFGSSLALAGGIGSLRLSNDFCRSALAANNFFLPYDMKVRPAAVGNITVAG